MAPPEALDKLTAALARLPGVGRRSAERMALAIVRRPDSLLSGLATALEEAGRTVRCCPRCGSVTSTGEEPCRLCTAPDRDGGVLCVVEEPGDIVLIERSGGYRGRYHALMGRISPMRGEGPRDLRIRGLLDRVAQEGFGEVILALSTDVEGDATAAYLAGVLKEKQIRVTRLAFGLPAGSGIAYSDPVTLARAFGGRTVESDTSRGGSS